MLGESAFDCFPPRALDIVLLTSVVNRSATLVSLTAHRWRFMSNNCAMHYKQATTTTYWPATARSDGIYDPHHQGRPRDQLASRRQGDTPKLSYACRFFLAIPTRPNLHTQDPQEITHNLSFPRMCLQQSRTASRSCTCAGSQVMHHSALTLFLV